ncbi:hypothetical protein MNV49_001034 [Pseudohyphozyma bogoriensis]|nr:hypothetical protein MNV49_001034 [Pseudohyphozyma bogoriensis]
MAHGAGSQGGGTKAPKKLVLSERFCSADADFELRSTDGHRFLVHKSNLLAGSKTFCEMFESSREESEAMPVLELVEDGETLEKMLPYFYLERIPLWEVDADKDPKYIVCFDKYQALRAIEAVEAAL